LYNNPKSVVFQLLVVPEYHLSRVLIQLDVKSVEIHNLRVYGFDPSLTSI